MPDPELEQRPATLAELAGQALEAELRQKQRPEAEVAAEHGRLLGQLRAGYDQAKQAGSPFNSERTLIGAAPVSNPLSQPRLDHLERDTERDPWR